MAMGKVAKAFNHGAVLDPVAVTSGHADQFELQISQFLDPLPYIFQMSRNNAVGFLATAHAILAQFQQGSDIVWRKTKIARMPDEYQSLQIVRAIASLTTLAALWLMQQADLFVISDGWHFHTT